MKVELKSCNLKNIFLLILITFNSINAQTVKVTPEGLVDAQDPTINYYVINSEGTALELRNKVLNYLNTIYESPKDVLTVSAPNQIFVNGRFSERISNPAVYVYYRINILFKDNKVKIDFPKINMSYPLNGGSKRMLFFTLSKKGGLSDTYGIWEKDKLRFHEAKSEIEEIMNNYLTNLVASIKANDDW